MAGELQASYRPTRTCYFFIRNRTGQIWNGSIFTTYASAGVGTYAVSATEQGTASAYYTATFPSAIAPGIYACLLKEQLGGSPAEADPVVATGDVQWGGTALLPLSDLATSGQVGNALPIRIARGMMLQNFPLYLRSAADHISPFTSGVVSGQIARDGGNFGPLQSGTISERGLGYYDVTLTSGDLNATTVKLLFTANGTTGGASDPLPFSFIMQRASGG